MRNWKRKKNENTFKQEDSVSRTYNPKEEYSEKFDDIRKASMEQSFYKYGPVRANYGPNGGVNAIESLKRYLREYERTGNTEFLTDVANFAMIEFMYPSIKGATFRRTGSDESPGLHGMSVNEVKMFKELEEV